MVKENVRGGHNAFEIKREEAQKKWDQDQMWIHIHEEQKGYWKIYFRRSYKGPNNDAQSWTYWSGKAETNKLVFPVEQLTTEKNQFNL